MVCKHKPGDPECSSHPDHPDNPSNRYVRQQAASTPDAEKYEILEVRRIGSHLVLKVSYPNCRKCSYEGVKVLVYKNVSETDVLRWKVIDPHFRDPQSSRTPREAPGPSARFPASKEGWNDALAYARSNNQEHPG